LRQGHDETITSIADRRIIAKLLAKIRFLLIQTIADGCTGRSTYQGSGNGGAVAFAAVISARQPTGDRTQTGTDQSPLFRLSVWVGLIKYWPCGAGTQTYQGNR
jgi:hypothetical protein